jgi:hypothetical protein
MAGVIILIWKEVLRFICCGLTGIEGADLRGLRSVGICGFLICDYLREMLLFLGVWPPGVA